VDEELHPLVSPYSADNLERRALAQEATGWDRAVVCSRPPERGPSGAEQAGSIIPSLSQRMINESLLPAATGPRIVTVRLPTHRDVQDHTLDALWHAPPPALLDVLVPLLGVDQRAVDRLHIGPILAALLHTLFLQGDSVRLWTEEQAGMSTHGEAEILDRCSRDALREVVLREVDTADAGNSRRANTGDPSARGQVRVRGTTWRRYKAGPSSDTVRGSLLGVEPPGGGSLASVVSRVIFLCLAPLSSRQKTFLRSCTTNPFSLKTSVPIYRGDLETQSREACSVKRTTVTPSETEPESHETQPGVTRPWRFPERACRPHRSQGRRPTHSRSWARERQFRCE